MPNNDMIQQERGLAMSKPSKLFKAMKKKLMLTSIAGAEFNDPVKPKQDTLMGTSYGEILKAIFWLLLGKIADSELSCTMRIRHDRLYDGCS